MSLSMYVRFLSLPALVLTGMLVYSCGPAGLEQKITRLEKQFQEGTSGGSMSFSSEEIRSLMKELAEAYEQYADEHPGEARSVESLYKAGEILETNLMDPKAAIAIYERIVTEYPQSERAADALFKQGFIYHNDKQIKDLEKAETIYREFVDRYPEHPLRKDAEFELKYLGLSDEELLKRLQSDTPPEESDTTRQGAPS